MCSRGKMLSLALMHYNHGFHGEHGKYTESLCKWYNFCSIKGKYGYEKTHYIFFVIIPDPRN